MEKNTLLSATDVMSIPKELMPMPVLSDYVQNFAAAVVKDKTDGMYGHFMWLVAPGICASQQTNGFKYVKLSDFLPDNRLKFWYNPTWTAEDRQRIIRSIDAEIKRPWYRNTYDFLAILGQWIGITSIQVPWADICSDKMCHVSLVDKRYDLKNPDPEDVNRWLKKTPPYLVYGRYITD